jgi:hypothetical protein
MSPSTYVLMAAFRLNPLDPTAYGEEFRVRDYTTVIGQSPNMIVANKDLSIGVSEKTMGWKIELRNDSEAEEAFFVDMNTQKVDMNRSWRVRLRYPQKSYIQIKDQVVSAAWNSVSFHNAISFDTISPILLKDTTEESIHLWVKDDRSLSTPFIKHSIVVAVPSKESMVFEFDLFKAEDINLDGKVNASDLSIVLGAWGSGRGDVNGDGTTDAKDQSLVLAAYDKTDVEATNP